MVTLNGVQSLFMDVCIYLSNNSNYKTNELINRKSRTFKHWNAMDLKIRQKVTTYIKKQQQLLLHQ